MSSKPVPLYWDLRNVVTFKSNHSRAAYMFDFKYLGCVCQPRYFICWQDDWDSDLSEDVRIDIVKRANDFLEGRIIR